MWSVPCPQVLPVETPNHLIRSYFWLKSKRLILLSQHTDVSEAPSSCWLICSRQESPVALSAPGQDVSSEEETGAAEGHAQRCWLSWKPVSSSGASWTFLLHSPEHLMKLKNLNFRWWKVTRSSWWETTWSVSTRFRSDLDLSFILGDLVNQLNQFKLVPSSTS